MTAPAPAVRHGMGIPTGIDVRDPGDIELDVVYAWLPEVDATFSPCREDSDMSRLGRATAPRHKPPAPALEAIVCWTRAPVQPTHSDSPPGRLTKGMRPKYGPRSVSRPPPSPPGKQKP